MLYQGGILRDKEGTTLLKDGIHLMKNGDSMEQVLKVSEVWGDCQNHFHYALNSALFLQQDVTTIGIHHHICSHALTTFPFFF
jgi:hypothetical protein